MYIYVLMSLCSIVCFCVFVLICMFNNPCVFNFSGNMDGILKEIKGIGLGCVGRLSPKAK